MFSTKAVDWDQDKSRWLQAVRLSQLSSDLLGARGQVAKVSLLSFFDSAGFDKKNGQLERSSQRTSSTCCASIGRMPCRQAQTDPNSTFSPNLASQKTNACVEIQDSSDDESSGSEWSDSTSLHAGRANSDMSIDSLGTASDGETAAEDSETTMASEMKECTICRDDVVLVAYVSILRAQKEKLWRRCYTLITDSAAGQPDD